MPDRLVGLADVLEVLGEDGPLSSDALAHRLGLGRLDARMVLVDAHALGLVRTTGRGEWAITNRGREATTSTVTRRRGPLWAGLRGPRWAGLRGPRWAGLRGPRWAGLRGRYVARRGVPLALGALVSAAAVAVASDRIEWPTGGPTVASTHTAPLGHGRRTHTRGRGRIFVASGSTAQWSGRRAHPLRSELTGAGRLETRRLRQERRVLGARCRQRYYVTPPARGSARHAAAQQRNPSSSLAHGSSRRTTTQASRIGGSRSCSRPARARARA